MPLPIRKLTSARTEHESVRYPPAHGSISHQPALPPSHTQQESHQQRVHYQKPEPQHARPHREYATPLHGYASSLCYPPPPADLGIGHFQPGQNGLAMAPFSPNSGNRGHNGQSYDPRQTKPRPQHPDFLSFLRATVPGAGAPVAPQYRQNPPCQQPRGEGGHTPYAPVVPGAGAPFVVQGGYASHEGHSPRIGQGMQNQQARATTGQMLPPPKPVVPVTCVAIQSVNGHQMNEILKNYENYRGPPAESKAPPLRQPSAPTKLSEARTPVAGPQHAGSSLKEIMEQYPDAIAALKRAASEQLKGPRSKPHIDIMSLNEHQLGYLLVLMKEKWGEGKNAPRQTPGLLKSHESCAPKNGPALPPQQKQTASQKQTAKPLLERNDVPLFYPGSKMVEMVYNHDSGPNGKMVFLRTRPGLVYHYYRRMAIELSSDGVWNVPTHLETGLNIREEEREETYKYIYHSWGNIFFYHGDHYKQFWDHYNPGSQQTAHSLRTEDLPDVFLHRINVAQAVLKHIKDPRQAMKALDETNDGEWPEGVPKRFGNLNPLQTSRLIAESVRPAISPPRDANARPDFLADSRSLPIWSYPRPVGQSCATEAVNQNKRRRIITGRRGLCAGREGRGLLEMVLRIPLIRENVRQYDDLSNAEYEVVFNRDIDMQAGDEMLRKRQVV